MGSANESSDLRKTFNYTGSYGPFSPSPFQLPTPTISRSDPSQIESEASLINNNNNNNKSLEGVNLHERCSSESFLMEEQPSWLDDLLNETESVNVLHRGHHRRSASDSYAYFGEAEDNFTLEDENKYVNSLFGTSSESEERISSLVVEHSNEDSADKASCGSQVKPSGGSKADSKRSKQHNAHRSRVRKLQHIAHLERTVQILKAEGSEVSAELEFLEQQNIILTMENRALRQRLESVSQEQIIKNCNSLFLLFIQKKLQ
ncbi:basic leucine zipper 2 [Phtheirospermum japonicum]|uniref:Basic leucine zipper 2 n=1 Tax=Phtheirospermum japonicum TaxID=374723 RepID=A0A830BH94_9LAMI|nr:basic leucine zipper 2 [Phtheirospermum japonicum]